MIVELVFFNCKIVTRATRWLQTTVVVFLLSQQVFASILVDSVGTTISTCANNGTATVFANSSPNPFLLYKIVAGPVLSNVQSSNVFASLYPGLYTARLYDINFDSVETQFTISGTYQLPYFLPDFVSPTCAGFTDGVIFGNADSSTGLQPYTWELLFCIGAAAAGRVHQLKRRLLPG